MDLAQLKYFQMVARLEHFTRAAEELYISQPSLSRAIARLEEELGAPLFDREGRQVRLNRLGRTFLRRVDRVFVEIEEGKREMQDLIGPEHGLVALAFLHTVGAQLLPEMLRAFREQHPHVTFQLSQNSTSFMLNQLEAGEIDMCIATPVPGHEGLGWAELMKEELFLAVPPGHRLAEYESVDLAEAAEEDFICLKSGYGMRSISDDLCHQAGFSPKVAFEGEELATVRGLVAAGLGVALVPTLGWQGVSDPMPVRIHIRKPISERTISLAWVENRYLPAAAGLFRQFVMKYFRDMSNEH